MLGFLIQLHLNMFFVLLAAGSLCAIWGLVLLFMSRSRPGAALTSARQPEAEALQAEQPIAEVSDASQEPADIEAAGQQTQRGSAEIPSPAGPPASRTSAIPPIYRSALVVTGGLALLQAALGGLLVALGATPRDSLHYVYGIVVLVAVPVAFTYMSGKLERSRRDLLFLVIAAVIVAAAAVRAYATGHP
ncbi:MAG TPA: hypothetical protein VH540_07335 [Ktedonobacterales bacterium]